MSLFVVILFLFFSFGIFCALQLWTPEWLIQQLEKSMRMRFRVKENVIGITIDDACSEGTEDLLDFFKKERIVVTFFVIGELIKPDIINRMVKEGHEVANHDFKNIWTVLTDGSGITSTHRALISLETNPKISFFRPGTGFFSEKILSICKKRNYECVLGNVYGMDPLFCSPRFLSWLFLQRTQPGSIAILHDGSKWRCQTTIQTLSLSIPEWRKRGYEFKTLSQMKQLEELEDSK